MNDFSGTTFTVEDGSLVMRVVPARRGKPYQHRCPLAAFEQVAHAIDESGSDGRFSLVDLQQRTGLPHTQVNVAFSFLKERSCVDPVTGRGPHKAVGDCVHLDAMTEYHALREKGAEPA